MTSPKDDWKFLSSRKSTLESDIKILKQAIKDPINNSEVLDIYRMIFKLRAELNKINEQNEKTCLRIEADYRKNEAKVQKKLCGNF